MSTSLHDCWFRTLARATQPSVSLYCFPPAGSGASFYRGWAKGLSAPIELHAVQYPGREDRIREPCAENLCAMADEIAEAMSARARAPVALFGHSLGAAVAYETARTLERRAPGLLTRFFPSGRPAPQRDRSSAIHDGGDDALWSDVSRLGGTRSSVLENEELRALLLPILRSDYRLSETYTPRGGPPLACDVVACIGDRDPEVDADEATVWSEVTRGKFSLKIFPGDHFFVLSASGELLNQLLESLAVPRSPSRSWPSTP